MGVNGMIDQGYAPSPGGALLGNVAYIPPGFEGKYLHPFTYTVTFASIGAVTLTGSTNIQNSSFFIVTQQYADIWDAATGNTTQVQPLNYAAAVRVLDTSSGGFMMDNPVPFGSYFGTALQPFTWLYRARVYQPGGQIQVELASRVAGPNRVVLSFTGFKVFDMPDTSAGL